MIQPPKPIDTVALAKLQRLAGWLDDRFRIPGTEWRIGLDGIVGLVPGIGDALTTAVSAYIVIEARRIGVPKTVLLRMIKNVAIDAIVGSVPLVGDVFDVAMKSNRKNMALVNEWAESLQQTKTRGRRTGRLRR